MKRIVPFLLATTIVFSLFNFSKIYAETSNNNPFEVIYLTEDEANELLSQDSEFESSEINYSRTPRCGTCTNTTLTKLSERPIYNRYLGLLPDYANGQTKQVNGYYMSSTRKATLSISLSYGPIGISVSNSGSGGTFVWADANRKSKLGMTVDGYETCWQATERYNGNGVLVRQYNFCTFVVTNEIPTVIYY